MVNAVTKPQSDNAWFAAQHPADFMFLQQVTQLNIICPMGQKTGPRRKGTAEKERIFYWEKCSKKGVVKKICVEDGAPVEFGQNLIILE